MNAFSQQSIKVVIPIYHCDQSIVAAATMYRVALLCKEQLPSHLVYHLHWVSIWQWTCIWVSIWQWTGIGYQFDNARANVYDTIAHCKCCMQFLRACCSGDCHKEGVRFTQLTYMQLDGVKDRATHCIETGFCDGLEQMLKEKSQTGH